MNKEQLDSLREEYRQRHQYVKENLSEWENMVNIQIDKEFDWFATKIAEVEREAAQKLLDTYRVAKNIGLSIDKVEEGIRNKYNLPNQTE